jgi:PKD repeat protein
MDFGNGVQSTDPNPEQVYNLAGSYPVTLVVTNSNGCSTPRTKAPFINVSPGVTASFLAPFPAACRPPVSVPLVNTSTGPGNLTYNWDFGNGTSSTAQNPTLLIYRNYRIRLTVNSDQVALTQLAKISYQIQPSNFLFCSDTVCLGQMSTS